MTGVIAKGSTVTLKLSQDFMEDNKYRVEATVTYSQEFDINAEPKTEVFQWEFIPSPAIDLYKNQISMGLIRAKGDTSEISVSFISPNPTPDAGDQSDPDNH